jgi:TonB family protein
MNAGAALLCCVALASATVVAQQPLSYEQRIARIDATLGELRKLGNPPEGQPGEVYRDLRGAVISDDLGRWAFTPSLVASASALAGEARTAAPEQDFAALDEADALMYPAVARAAEIQDYWNLVPRISWRDHWTAFASANGLNPQVIDPDLVFEEKQLLEALDAGAFKAAARRARSLDELFETALRSAISGVISNRKSQELAYVARSSPCPAAVAPTGTAPARLTKPGDPDALYPPGAKQRGEHGTIVVRARVSPESCATAFAVVVRSGYPELDTAAIKVAEASRYKAAVEAGKPQAGEIDFKVRFEFKYE